MKSKRGQGFGIEKLGGWGLIIAVLVLSVVGIALFLWKGSALIEALKNIFRFGS